MHNRAPIIGLALGSGAAKGWAHIGVIRALTDMGYKPQVVAGSSIGAVVGAVYVNGKMDNLEEWARSLTRNRKFWFMDVRLRSGGLVAGKRLMSVLEEHIGHVQIQDCAMPFAAVATSFNTGREIWLRHGQVVDAVRASMAIPGIFSPVFMRNQWLLDGGLSNPVPVSLARALGADIVLAVNLSNDNTGYKFKPNKDSGSLVKAISLTPTYDSGETPPPPSLLQSFFSSIEIMSDRIARGRLAGDPADVTITPRVGEIRSADFERADEAIAEGYAAVQRVKPLLEEALGRFPIEHPG